MANGDTSHRPDWPALLQLKARDGMPETEAIRRGVAEFLAKKGIATVVKAERKRAGTRRR